MTFIIMATIVVLHTIVFLLSHQNVIPIYDEWALWTTLHRLSEGKDTLIHALFAAHNEHRILLTRLAFLLDVATGGKEAVLRVLTILTQASTTAMLLWLLISDRRPNWIDVCASATVIALMLTLRQGENFTSGFQLQFVLAIAVPCMILIAWTTGKGLTNRVLMTGGLLLISPFTMANGIMAGLCLIATTLLVHDDPKERYIAVFLGLGSIALPVALGYGPKPSGAAAPPPTEVLTYSVIYLGGMATSIRLHWATIGGSIGLVAFCAFLLRYRGLPAAPQDAVLLSLAGYAIATALVTAWGRLGDGWPVSQALSGRYATTSALFWSAMIAHAARRNSPSTRGPLLAFLIVAMVLIVRDSHSYDHALGAQYEATRSVEHALCNDERPIDDLELKAIGVDRQTFETDTNYMRSIGRGVCQSQ